MLPADCVLTVGEAEYPSSFRLGLFHLLTKHTISYHKVQLHMGLDSLTMLSDVADVGDADDLFLQMGIHQHELRAPGACTPFESPISVLSAMASPKPRHEDNMIMHESPFINMNSPSRMQRLSVTTLTAMLSSPPRVNKRKQSVPHRSIKQLESLAEKIINGIIVVEPRVGYEEPTETPRKKPYNVPIVIQAPEPIKGTRMSSNNGNGSRASQTRKREELKIIIRSPASDVSRSPSPSDRESMNASPASNPNSKPTSMIGKHIDADFEPSRLASRVELYNQIYRKRRSPGSVTSLGSTRMSGFGGTPLDISQAPGSSLLDETEFELCSLLRLQPLQYFQSRDTLLRNYRERGFYKKSAAQKMLHIDVNKTGRLYDFFVMMRWMPENEGQEQFTDPMDIDWQQLAE